MRRSIRGHKGSAEGPAGGGDPSPGGVDDDGWSPRRKQAAETSWRVRALR